MRNFIGGGMLIDRAEVSLYEGVEYWVQLGIGPGAICQMQRDRLRQGRSAAIAVSLVEDGS